MAVLCFAPRAAGRPRARAASPAAPGTAATVAWSPPEGIGPHLSAPCSGLHSFLSHSAMLSPRHPHPPHTCVSVAHADIPAWAGFWALPRGVLPAAVGMAWPAGGLRSSAAASSPSFPAPRPGRVAALSLLLRTCHQLHPGHGVPHATPPDPLSYGQGPRVVYFPVSTPRDHMLFLAAGRPAGRSPLLPKPPASASPAAAARPPSASGPTRPPESLPPGSMVGKHVKGPDEGSETRLPKSVLGDPVTGSPHFARSLVRVNSRCYEFVKSHQTRRPSPRNTVPTLDLRIVTSLGPSSRRNLTGICTSLYRSSMALT